MSLDRKLFNRVCSVTALALALTVGLQAFQPREAKAILIVEAPLLASGQEVWGPGAVLLCVLYLPLCLLDQHGAPASSYSRQDLLDNGYSVSQVNQIERDQTAVMSDLRAKHQQLEIQSTDTRESLAKALRAIDPRVSDEYVDFVADTNHLN